MSQLFNPIYCAARWLVLTPKPSVVLVSLRTAVGAVISYAMAHLILLAAHLAGPSFSDLHAPTREFNDTVLKVKAALFQSPAAPGASPAPPGESKGGGTPGPEAKKAATPSVILPQIMHDDAGKVAIQFLIADAGGQGLRIDPVTWATTKENLHVRGPVIQVKEGVPWGWLGIEYQAPLSIDAIGKAIEALQGTIGRENELDATERDLFKARQLDGKGEERLQRFLQPRKPVEAKKWEGLLRRYQSALAAFQRSQQYQRFNGKLAIARRINGPIQFLTLWPFCGLVLIVVARRLAFVKDEQRETLPLTDAELKKITGTDMEEAAAKIEKAYGTLGLLRLQVYKLGQELSNAIPPIEAQLEEAKENGLSEDSDEIKKAIKDKEDTYRRVVQKHAVEIERHGLNIETYLNQHGARFLPYHRMTHAAIVGALAGSAVPEHINQLVTAEEQSLSNQLYISGTACRYILWFIPTMGFIGTVWGISDSLLLTTQLDSLDPLIKIAAKSKINTSIGVAFDTTFVSLLLAAVGMLMHARVSEAEDGLIHRASEYARKLFLTVLNAMPHADVQVNQLSFVNESGRSGEVKPPVVPPTGEVIITPVKPKLSPALKSLLVVLGFILLLAVIVFVLSQPTK